MIIVIPRYSEFIGLLLFLLSDFVNLNKDILFFKKLGLRLKMQLATDYLYTKLNHSF